MDTNKYKQHIKNTITEMERKPWCFLSNQYQGKYDAYVLFYSSFDKPNIISTITAEIEQLIDFETKITNQKALYKKLNTTNSTSYNVRYINSKIDSLLFLLNALVDFYNFGQTQKGTFK